ncbi:phospholipase effector Tle1 domain-containing protein [Vibrio proteolyticus]|uniref:Uncharacterized protein n=1 Tax=Vibrio proteolyticus NBRC 13287 TaxID=1219065 RepID=U2ZJC6_VIBPR|nr:DUF2235 domain-containing protein [Vibrio proteolyticus]GAD67836.1 hypothetical protein VPR01S_10_00320 [Vibrio proteolyticus NBRC 13287]
MSKPFPFPPETSMFWKDNAYDYDAAAEVYSNAGTLSAVNQKPTKASDDQGGYPPEHSVFWQGGTDKAEQQQSVSSSASELNWIEIRLVDEHNQPFNSVPGVLKDSAGKCFPVKASQGNILLCNIAQGAVELQFDNPAWLQDSEARKPYQGEQDPVCVWIEENVVGYKATPRQLLNATAGDFVVLQPEQVLPERHQAGKADTINLESGNSYLIKVRGFNYITLRVGMFFDGTGNNTFSAQWGKQQFERYIGEWKQRFEQGKNEIAKKAGISPSEVKIKDLPGNCFSYPNDRFYWFWQDDESVDGSATNELTNIQKLHDLYSSFFREKTLLQDQNLYVHREYVTGIGTGNETNLAPADESIFPGQALGTGDYGVVAKVSTGIEQLCDHISQLSVDIEPYTFDGIGCIEFDVFGFSRGAAAARHFVNVMAEGSRGELAQNLEKAMVSQGIVLSSSFAWDESRNCCANFVGLFDTVAAIVDFGRADFTPHNNDNGDVRLWLDPAKVKSAVHLTAHPTTEYRYNFCLNKLNPAGHFLEVVLPGAHSDLGGGYHATGYYDDPEYLLPRLESKCIAKVQRPHNDNVYSYERTREYLSKRLDVELAKEVSLGWEASNYTKEFVSRGAGNRPVLIGKLYKKRVVEGELSRLYLRLMFGLALNKGVPFHSNAIPDINDVNNKNFNVSEKIGDIEFKKKADSVLEQALQGCVDPSLMNQDMLIKLQKSNLIHHSSDNGIANKPNEHKQSGRYVRQVFECKE